MQKEKEANNESAHLKKLKQHGSKRITLTGGESAIHPQFEEIFLLLAKYEFTNTALLTKLYYPEALQDKVIDLACKYKIGINTSYDGFAGIADKLRAAKAQFAQCPGCWNTCYTISSRALSYLHLGTIRQYLQKDKTLHSTAEVPQ
ncbi:MAG: hypothetical protein M0Q16_00965 [Candidatus Cloacimonetes bacterium]|nr:hypothetical protein [Candidatus Cloacimonadota bacterium]MCK9183930.1 hypothetical protein [Candidatus Cloacimonadota bacterium]